MWRPAKALSLSALRRADLEALVRSGKTLQRVVTRALIVLAAADGTPINAIARECGLSRPTVYLWRDRFQHAGVLGLVKAGAPAAVESCGEPWSRGTRSIAYAN